MRAAALAFGVLAGLVASLILALGGLDPAFLPQVDARQLQFALFVIANLGVFGAALALAAPLAAAILMLVAAAAWGGSAFLLKHGADYVLITPPALLAIGAAFAIMAFVFRPRLITRETPAIETSEPQGAPAQLRGLDPADQIRADDDWQPGKKRPAGRQEPVFREPDDDEDAESGLARFVRGISTVLSFGLYAALAGAAVLIFLNLRSADLANAPLLEARSSSVAAVTAPPSSSIPPAAPVLTAPSSSDPLEAVQTLLSVEPGGTSEEAATFRTVGPAPGPAAEASAASLAPILASSALASSSSSVEVPVQLEPQNLLAEVSSSSSVEPPPEAAAAPPVMPFTVPAQMAAQRERPAPPPSQAAPTGPTGGDTGL